MSDDKRIAYGARCTWWDSIDKVGKRYTGPLPIGPALPCCPHCKGMLLEMDSASAWWDVAAKFEADGHKGYRRWITWLRGKCYPTPAAALKVFDPDAQIVKGMEQFR